VVVQLLAGLHSCCGTVDDARPGVIAATWTLKDGVKLQVVANLCAHARGEMVAPVGAVFWQERSIGEDGKFEPWAVRWSVAGR
jgi:hypothetical protein